MNAGTLLVSIISSGVAGLLVGLVFYFLMPKAIDGLGKYATPENLKMAAQGIDKLQAIKAAVDTDPLHEDMVEKILRYAEMSVVAANQVFSTKDDNAKKKEFALKFAQDLLTKFKETKSPDSVAITELEKNVINGMIETVVAIQKKQVAATESKKS